MDASAGTPATLLRSDDTFSLLSPGSLAALVSAASDVAVVLDRDGVVRDLAVGDADLPQEVSASWIGRPFRDSVTVESRDKVERLLSVSGDAGKVVTLAHINHARPGADDLPIRYASTALTDGAVIALGRDLSPISNAQRRLLAAQRSADREYQKIKAAEARFREYFFLSREPSLFLDAEDRVVGANQAAQTAWSRLSRLIGRRASDLVAAADRQRLADLLADARQTQSARSDMLAPGHIIVAPLRQERGVVLLRISESSDRTPTMQERLSKVVEAMPDGFVVTDPHFNILVSNDAFAAMTEAGGTAQIAGTSLDRWLGRPGVDLSVIRAALSEAGTIRAFNTVVRGDLGQIQEVDVSAAKISDPHGEYVGLTVRQAAVSDTVLPTRSAQQLADLVGRVPIKEIVRETTDTIERMCIEAALELSGDNRASAAELLGLSRQSLYVKMRRFGIVDADPDSATIATP